MRRWLSLLALAGVIPFMSAHGQTKLAPETYHLLMAGGGLHACSSMAPQYCNKTDWIDRNSMRTDRYLNIDEKHRKEATAEAAWPSYREKMRNDVAEALRLIHDRIRESVIPERVFQEEFTRRATKYLYNKLSDAEWRRIVNLLEMPVPEDTHEVVNLDENLNQNTVQIFQRFVDMAKRVHGAKDGDAKVLFTTSADFDPYDKVSYYQDIFSQLGVEAEWLPIDAAVITAARDGQCETLNKVQEEVLGSYNRDKVYPNMYQQQVTLCKNLDSVEDMIASADGLFLNDGEVNLTRETFVTQNNRPNDILRTIIQRVSEEHLVVGGSGAGAAVLTSKAMVSNGTTEGALKQQPVASDPPAYGCDLDQSCPPNTQPNTLTYHPMGGMSLFHFGLLDTHVSDMGRQGRLMRLAAEVKSPFGAGIDERTALLVNLKNGHFKIIGEQGVFFVEDAQQGEHAVAGLFHYLVAGASGLMTPTGIETAEFAKDLDVVKAQPTTDFLTDRGLTDSIRVLCDSDKTSLKLLSKDFQAVVQLDDASRTQAAGGECQIINGRLGIAWQPQASL
ncbi:cyanophycinase [Idiomarina tyrosinivorans]|uniref:Cyanophycinase n=1 Tax=Idiomarina tyrosinivorans TaxID=1445662 RepID=A0A432ZQ49_9GAMM|nr:cyanophycinase [Idiomarina tyrosinivorans]RUO79958.1 cyanophycinase [Idiomarina tyrosinivorans]